MREEEGMGQQIPPI